MPSGASSSVGNGVELMGLELAMVTPEDLIVAKLEWARKGGSELQLRNALVPRPRRAYARSGAGGDFGAGSMFWLRRKKFVGSYFSLSATSRS